MEKYGGREYCKDEGRKITQKQTEEKAKKIVYKKGMLCKQGVMGIVFKKITINIEDLTHKVENQNNLSCMQTTVFAKHIYLPS